MATIISESDSDYEAKISQLIFIEGSKNNSNEILQETEELEKEVKSHICLDVIKASLMSDTSSYICKEGEKLEELYSTVNK
ncbi:13106_t:CDS:2 [Funneliformis mosseae]|uniref:13106_t:CDS:1 n=1 Tax=Funneliformis mosseae TaxID=27381 RepID=A0A9N9GB70_FUNMO|nr:13106_t:CDS:2 [Funneliformis mosseae]